MKKESQLALFADLRQDIDKYVFEFQNQINAYKTLALQLETSLGKENKAFMYAKEIARAYGMLGEAISKEGIKYRHLSAEYWERHSSYKPYYAALEPRSPIRLYDVARDYKSRSNSLLLRFKAIFGNTFLYPVKIVEQITELGNRMVQSISKEYHVQP